VKGQEMNGFLDRGTTFKGDLTFDDMLRIDGKFEGTIRSDSTLIVGDAAEIKGEIHVDSVTVNGRVEGQIHAKSRVEVNGQARISGEIHTPCLVIQDGAVFDGTITMSKQGQTAKSSGGKGPQS